MYSALVEHLVRKMWQPSSFGIPFSASLKKNCFDPQVGPDGISELSNSSFRDSCHYSTTGVSKQAFQSKPSLLEMTYVRKFVTSKFSNKHWQESFCKCKLFLQCVRLELWSLMQLLGREHQATDFLRTLWVLILKLQRTAYMVGSDWRAWSHGWQNVRACMEKSTHWKHLTTTQGGKKSNSLKVNTEEKTIPITKAPCAMPHVPRSPLPVPPTQANLKSHKK